MSSEIVGIIVVVVAILACKYGDSFAISAFIPSTIFGSAAASNVAGVGTIPPAHVLLGVSTFIILFNRERFGVIVKSISFPRAGFWLVCTLLIGLLGSFFLPRILGSTVLVNPINQGGVFGGYTPVPLRPTTGNLTQSVYFSADIVCFLVCVVYLQTAEGFQTVVRALLSYCVLDIVLAFVDIATSSTNTTYLLEFIRNAKYTIFVDTPEGSIKRIIGSFTEASAFASATLGVFGFASQLWLEEYRPRLTSLIAFVSLGLLLASTSSTAYVGLSLGLTVTMSYCILRVMRGNASYTMSGALIFTPLIVISACLAIVLNDKLYYYIWSFLDMMVFNKGQSQSGIERGLINIYAWNSFLQSGGLGVGIGSVRASSFALAVLANIGVVGALLYGTALVSALAPSSKVDTDPYRSVRRSARSACIYLLIPAFISGALIDLGLPFFIFLAVASVRRSATPQTARSWMELGHAQARQRLNEARRRMARHAQL